MLPEALLAWQRAWLLVLLGLWAIFLFGGFIVGSGDPQRRMPRWTRMASSAVLVVAAWSWVLFSRESNVFSYAIFIAAGMTLGFVGDLWLAGVLPGGRNVLGGMAAFGVGHVFYIAAILFIGGPIVMITDLTGTIVLGVWLLIGLVGWYVVVARRRKSGTLRWAALGYALLLATTAGLASSLALQTPAFIPLAIGAGLFLLSDLVLAGELFAGLHFRYIGDVVWLTYGPAQMLIVYSIGAALAA